MANQAWWTYPIINNFGVYPDPEGKYPKPDINILAPANTPFTAFSPGVITGIDTTSSYGDVVTVKFNNPVNSAATHYAFEHLSSISPGLFVGENVNTGTVLGYGGGDISKSGADPGLALTASDVYGTGSGWSNNVSGTWINPLLNPTALLNSLNNGSFSYSSSGVTSVSNCDPNTPIVGYFCNAQNQLTLDIAGIQSWLTQAGIVIFGAVIVLVALILMFK